MPGGLVGCGGRGAGVLAEEVEGFGIEFVNFLVDGGVRAAFEDEELGVADGQHGSRETRKSEMSWRPKVMRVGAVMRLIWLLAGRSGW